MKKLSISANKRLNPDLLIPLATASRCILASLHGHTIVPKIFDGISGQTVTTRDPVDAIDSVLNSYGADTETVFENFAAFITPPIASMRQRSG